LEIGAIVSETFLQLTVPFFSPGVPVKRFEEIYDYWVGDGRPRMELWFKKDPKVDNEIRAKFGPWLDDYDASVFEPWKSTPQGLVSLVILLDQFPRNAYRGTPRMFEFDNEALEVAKEGLEKGLHDQLNLFECMFLTLPLEHSEDITDQIESVRLFQDLDARTGPEQKAFSKSLLDYAVRHHAIIERFGRFPHRNEVLGRASTPEEIEFLKTPGSGF